MQHNIFVMYLLYGDNGLLIDTPVYYGPEGTHHRAELITPSGGSWHAYKLDALGLRALHDKLDKTLLREGRDV